MDYIYFGLIALNLAILGWLIFLTVKYRRITQKAEIIFKDQDAENLQKMLKRYFKDIEAVNDDHQKLRKVLDRTRKTANLGLNKVSFMRYNPFGDVGSDQSFSMCLLNSDLDGFVISSIHSREGTRVYAKPVNGGSSTYNLSKEEQKVINLASGEKIAKQ